MHIPLATSAKKVLLALGSIAVAVLVFASIASASASDNLGGYAWSSNIGWIKANNCDTATACPGTQYGLTMDSTTGDLSGYAWSSNIGWISFNGAAVNDCPRTIPASPCQAKINLGTGKLSGWARACSVLSDLNCTTLSSTTLLPDEARGGWDGYISLGDSDTSDNVPFGVTFNTATGTFNGCSAGSCAWGSDVVGWMDMSGVKVTTDLGDHAVFVNASPAQVVAGDSSTPVTVSYYSAGDNPTSCTTAGDWVSEPALATTATQSQLQGVLTSVKIYSYTLTCTYADTTTASDTATVTVTKVDPGDLCPDGSPKPCDDGGGGGDLCPDGSPKPCDDGGGGGDLCPNYPPGIQTNPLPAHYRVLTDGSGRCGCDAGYVMNQQFQCVIPVFQEE